MLNRTLPPVFHPIEDIDLIQPSKQMFDNGLTLFSFDYGDQEIVRIQWIFKNLPFQPDKALQNNIVAGMILEGTQRYTNAVIAEKVDFYGAFLQPEYTADHFSLSLFTLSKYVDKLLPLVFDILTDSIFPEKELKTYMRTNQQSTRILLEKNDFLARRAFNHALFGDSIYGHRVELNDYERVSRADLLGVYQQQMIPSNCTVFIAGKVKPPVLQLLADIFGTQWQGKAAVSTESKLPEWPDKSELIRIKKPNSVQSAIRIGQRSIRRTDPDFPALQLLNSVLGGYFGSRLMANIREDKGYTYGIGSGLVSLNQAGYFTLSTEVGTNYVEPTLIEIDRELNRLRNEPVLENELILVKNYVLGSLLGSLENVFSHADKFKQVYFSGLDLNYYHNYIDQIKNTNAQRIQALAQKYFTLDNMVKVVVG